MMICVNFADKPPKRRYTRSNVKAAGIVIKEPAPTKKPQLDKGKRPISEKNVVMEHVEENPHPEQSVGNDDDLREAVRT